MIRFKVTLNTQNDMFWLTFKPKWGAKLFKLLFKLEAVNRK